MKKLPLWVEKDGGLRFECTGCGNCCRGGEGYVFVGAGEIERLAAFLGLALDDFGRRYLRRVGARYSLLERRSATAEGETSFDCVFWAEDRGCTVYEARPVQCRTFPFWPEVIRSQGTWRDEAKRCPGISAGLEPGSRARRYAPEEILRLARGEGETSAP